jgi:hypothetical protein
MKSNLTTLRAEIEEYLRSHDVAVFYSVHPAEPHIGATYWDTAAHPDFRTCVATAEAAGVRLITMFANEFQVESIDSAVELLEESEIPREDRRVLEKQLREFRGCVGFICDIELSFYLGSHAYVFDLRTDWFEEYHEILDRIEEDTPEDDEEPMGGPYFSKN